MSRPGETSTWELSPQAVRRTGSIAIVYASFGVVTCGLSWSWAFVSPNWILGLWSGALACFFLWTSACLALFSATCISHRSLDDSLEVATILRRRWCSNSDLRVTVLSVPNVGDVVRLDAGPSRAFPVAYCLLPVDNQEEELSRLLTVMGHPQVRYESRSIWWFERRFSPFHPRKAVATD